MRNIYLDDKRAQFAVHDDVESEDLEAGAASDVTRKTRPVVVPQRSVRRDQRLYHHVVNLVPQPLHVVAILLQPPIYRRNPPTQTTRVVFRAARTRHEEVPDSVLNLGAASGIRRHRLADR